MERRANAFGLAPFTFSGVQGGHVQGRRAANACVLLRQGYARSVGVTLKTELSFGPEELAALKETIKDFQMTSGAEAEHLKLAAALVANLEAQGLTVIEVTVADHGRLYGVPCYCALAVVNAFAPNALEILRGFAL